jgi:DNA-binding FadR family transcriptional regulator
MNLIRNSALKVGEKMLPERDLSEKLEVSIHFNH